MTLKVAVQMDHIETIDVKGDSTFALLLEAQRRHYHIMYYLPDALTLNHDTLTAYAQSLEVEDKITDYFSLGEMQKIKLAEYDVVLMRQDPPFDMHYLTATYLLEKIHPQTLVVNHPVEVRNAPEKIFVTEFAQFMPPTLITRNRDEIKYFHRIHKEIILKPLYGNGGEGVIHIGMQDRNLNALMEIFETISKNPYIVQKYQSEVRQGDKRIILINGDAVGAINRVPDKQDNRSNMHVGGKAEKSTLTKKRSGNL